MSAATNKALLKRYIQEVWEKQNLKAIDEFLAPTYLRHRSPQSEPLTRAGQKELLAGFRVAFPDLRIQVEEVLAEGDRIAFRSTMQGTHLGEFLGVPPTGKWVTFGLLDLIRIEEDKFVEQWGGPDLFDLLGQLGASLSLKKEG